MLNYEFSRSLSKITILEFVLVQCFLDSLAAQIIESLVDKNDDSKTRDLDSIYTRCTS